jgi:hypothetical protein
MVIIFIHPSDLFYVYMESSLFCYHPVNCSINTILPSCVALLCLLSFTCVHLGESWHGDWCTVYSASLRQQLQDVGKKLVGGLHYNKDGSINSRCSLMEHLVLVKVFSQKELCATK